MKKLVLVLSALLVTSGAFADLGPLPRPKPKAKIETMKVDGFSANALYEALEVDIELEAALRTRSSWVKVLRSEDGLFQIVCHFDKYRTIGAKKDREEYKCTIEKSLDGKEIPEYVIRRIMG